MEPLSTLMLAIITMLLLFNIPRTYAVWLSFQNLLHDDDYDELQALLAAENLWAQRHFWCALMAICMAIVIDNSALGASTPRLSQVTTLYAGISLSFAIVEAFLAQKIAVLLSARQVAIRSRGKDPR
jgi:hypothetical protein